jgi:hypothetical protein
MVEQDAPDPTWVHIRSQDVAATVFNNKIYVAYTVEGDYLKVAWHEPSIPSMWLWSSASVGTQRSKWAPAIAVANNRLHLVYVAANATNTLLATSSADGRSWTVQTTLGGQSSRLAPAMIYWQGALRVFYVSNNDAFHLLFTTSSDGTHWSDDSMLGGQTSASPPAVAQLGFHIYLPLVRK